MALNPQGTEPHPMLTGTAQNTQSNHPHYHTVSGVKPVNNVVMNPPSSNLMGHYASHQSSHPIIQYSTLPPATSNVGS